MFTRLATILLLTTTSLACNVAEKGMTDTRLADAAVDAAPEGHSLTVKVSMHPDGDEIRFFNASNAVVTAQADYFRGKPWAALVFAGGADPATDDPIQQVWGTVPDSLEFEVTPDRTFPDGPYDVVVLIFGTTEITDDHRSGASKVMSVTGGDLVSFTNEHSQVREGDPDFNGTAGLVRVNVEGGAASLALENRISSVGDPEDVRRASVINTILWPF